MWHFIYAIALVALNQDGISTPIEAQQFLAKGHERNKCLNVSSLCNRQLTCIGIKDHAPPSKHTPRAQSVLQQQPEKNILLRLAL
jgi:hypothetical protein